MPFTLQIPSLLAIGCLVFTPALATPAHGLPDALAPRAACPTETRYRSYPTVTSALTTETITHTERVYGSTTTTEGTLTRTNGVTVYSPATVSDPSTRTFIKSVVADVIPTYTETETYTTTVVQSDYAPESECQTTTFYTTLAQAPTATVTIDRSVVVVEKTESLPVETVTTYLSFPTVTQTFTEPGETVYAATTTLTETWTPYEYVIPTTTSTLHLKGCKAWACQAQ
ncbi:hypothetical protein GGS20DRAFT_587613 [Poronia punctata]|nr:hypothetical protein GGS20DRAFT_587613 [Poronia punctata]